MSNMPSIIGVEVVNSEWDEYWNELPEQMKSQAPVDTVVITTPFTSQSALQNQLEKMMQACKLDRSQYYVLQISKDKKIAWHKIREAYQPKNILLLGILPMQLGISAGFHLYAPNRFDGCVFIASLSLEEMEQQPEVKKQLWSQGLKPVFVDNLQ